MNEPLLNRRKGVNPALAAGCLFNGFKWLGRSELRKFILIPILVNLLLFSGVLLLGYYYLDDLIKQFIPDWLGWLSWIIQPLFFISFFIAGFFTFTLFANLIAAPFYGKLAAKTLSILSSNPVTIIEPPINKVLWAEIIRIGYLVTRALPLLILFIIPGINLIAPFLWISFGAWGMALEYSAYPLENQGLLFSEQRQQLRSVRLGALSFGGLALMGLTIPVFNILVPPAAVIGATIYIYALKGNQMIIGNGSES